MVDSANSQAEGTSEATPGRESGQTGPAIQQIAELLGADEDAGQQGKDGDGDAGESKQAKTDDDQQAGTDDGKPGESQNKGKPKTLNDVAERLGVDVKDLFAIEFNLGGDGESHTLGELKDVIGERDDFEVDRLRFGEEKAKQEAAIVKAYSELNDLIGMLPKNAIKPELVRAIQAKREQAAERERGRTLNVIPEWRDESREDSDRKAMREHLGEYGFPDNYLETILDSRTLMYIRDNWQRAERIKRALAQVKQADKKPGHKPGVKKTTPRRDSKRQTGGKPRAVTEQVSAITELLSNA